MSAGSQAVRIETGSRLHFGLLAVPSVGPRRFGGAGVMVEHPRLSISAISADTLRVEGPLAERGRKVLDALAATQGRHPGLRLTVHRCPPQHVGLGTGTQHALALASAARLAWGGELRVLDLARRVGRGHRSAIGIHGFRHGGFLVDGGRSPQGDIAPLVARAEVPRDWRFLLVIPHAVAAGPSGSAERDAFRHLKESPHVDRLCRLVLLGLLPSVTEADVVGFSQALHEYGRLAAEPFRQLQGGVYGHEFSRRVLDFLSSEGVRGTGQTSWGPTSYAVLGDEERAMHVAGRLRARFGLEEAEVVVTAARNRGFDLAREPASSVG